MRMKFLKSSEISSLPRQPGVYLLYSAKKMPLYIGKSSNLKERIKNHFSQPSYKDNLFVSNVKKIGFIPLKSDIEALILEAQLIKKYQPKFNILFRDDKKYFYVGITKEDWPRIFITHQPKVGREQRAESREYKVSKKLSSALSPKPLATHIGPFTDGKALKQTLKVLRKIFPYRSCKKLPKKPCLWYQLSRCPAPCLIEKEAKVRKVLLKQTKERKMDYKNDIKKLKSVLEGKRKSVISNLKKEMKKMAKLQEFERAAKIKSQIESLERVFSHRSILIEFPKKVKREHIGILLKKSLNLPKIPKKIEGYDISNIKGKEMVGSMVAFKLSPIAQGEFREYKYIPYKNGYRRFKIKTIEKQNDIACLKEIISRRFRHTEWKFPDLIYVDGGKAQFNATKEVVLKFAKANLEECIPIISLAKKKNILYNFYFKDSLSLDNLPKEVKMVILRLRDEAHRFAISYHKKLRKKALFSLKTI